MGVHRLFSKEGQNFLWGGGAKTYHLAPEKHQKDTIFLKSKNLKNILIWSAMQWVGEVKGGCPWA